MFNQFSEETKELAKSLYLDDGMSVSDIARKLDIARSTVDGWLKPYTAKNRSEGQQRKSEAMKAHYESLRDEAYQEAREQASELLADPFFRDFVAMYIGEGYKKSLNDVAIANSNPPIMLMAQHFLMKLTDNKLLYDIQVHISQDEQELKQFWGDFLTIDPQQITTIRVSTSDQSSGRKFNSEYGVLTIRVGDTYLRARLEAWMEHLRELWGNTYGNRLINYKNEVSDA